MIRLLGGLATAILAISTAFVIGAAATVLFLNPVWVAFEQDRAQAHAWTGFTETQLRAATNAILDDLVVGPPDFDVEVDGVPVLNEREQGHMRDVRAVFAGFFLLAVAAGVVLAVGWLRRGDGIGFWRAVGRGGLGLAVGTIVIGGLGILFFDAAFELFHQVFFPAGSYTFDPRTERLVQLFPYRFWIETTVALAVVLVIAGALGGLLALRHVERLRARTATPKATAFARPRTDEGVRP
jgi:integral membrane protein (TIGR01906 family)